MWEEDRWCSVTWGGKSGQNCWKGCSCSRLQKEGPSRPQPAAGGTGDAEGKPLAGPYRRTNAEGMGHALT